MQSNNPVFNSNSAFGGRRGQASGGMTSGYAATDLQSMYDSPSATNADMGRMTLDDVIMRTAAMFAVLIGFAFVGWQAPGLALVGALVGLGLGLFISFKSSTNPALNLAYAAAQGLLVGGVSQFYARLYDGNLVGQAVLGTCAAFAAMLVLYKTGVLRATPKFTKGLMIAAVGYLFVGLASLIAGLFGVNGGWGFREGGLGLLICAAGVVIASLFLVLDFDFIEQGIRQGLPQRYAWLGAFGLVVTLVWLYLDMLRLLSILRGDN